MNQNAKIQIELTDNSPEVLAVIPNAIARALWAVGAAAEGHAKENETRVDTLPWTTATTAKSSRQKKIFSHPFFKLLWDLLRIYQIYQCARGVWSCL